MKIRVLQLAKFNFDYKGGIEKVASKIHTLLNKKYSVFTICLGTNCLKKKKIFIEKINFSFSSFNFSIGYLFKVFKYKRKFNYVIGHMPNPLCIVLLFFPKKYYLFWHSDIIEKNFLLNLIYKPIEILLIIFSKKIIFTSDEYYKKSYARIFNKSYYIMPLSASETNHLVEIKKISSPVKLLSVGRLVKYKNYFFLLNVLQKLSNFSLTIVGEGPEHYKLQKFIDQNNIQNIKILRNVSDESLIAIYKSHDIFCLASNTRAEAFGIVLIEALSHGLPILVGNNNGSGMVSICENNYNGLIFDYNNIEFEKKLLEISKNYKYFSMNALKSYHKKYTDHSFASNISSLISLAK
jgi:glycosyltransferase involved in cell wall biosynthesis